MNNIEKAIEFINNCPCVGKEKEVKTIIECLNKQIPKEINITVIEKGKDMVLIDYLCPNCNQSLKHIDRCCSICGQVIK